VIKPEEAGGVRDPGTAPLLMDSLMVGASYRLKTQRFK